MRLSRSAPQEELGVQAPVGFWAPRLKQMDVLCVFDSSHYKEGTNC